MRENVLPAMALIPGESWASHANRSRSRSWPALRATSVLCNTRDKVVGSGEGMLSLCGAKSQSAILREAARWRGCRNFAISASWGFLCVCLFERRLLLYAVQGRCGLTSSLRLELKFACRHLHFQHLCVTTTPGRVNKLEHVL